MKDRDDDASTAATSNLYGVEYYSSHCGPVRYDRSEPVWFELFGKIAKGLVETFHPKRVFDGGCAHGFLVEALRDRGVEAWGRDISSFAIASVRSDLQPYCSVGSLSDPIDGRYDLIVCIEVLEHMTERDGMTAIEQFARSTDRVLFSSSPNDFDEPTHINVQSGLYWMRAFAARGFRPALELNVSYLTPYAVCFEKCETPPDDATLEGYAETVHNRHLDHLSHQIAALHREIDLMKGSLSWRLTEPMRWVSRRVKGHET